MTVQVLLAVVGSTGLLGSVVAFWRLRPDADTAAVTQSQGAVETMALLQRELERDRDQWRARAQSCETEIATLRAELEKCQRAHGRRTRD